MSTMKRSFAWLMIFVLLFSNTAVSSAEIVSDESLGDEAISVVEVSEDQEEPVEAENDPEETPPIEEAPPEAVVEEVEITEPEEQVVPVEEEPVVLTEEIETTEPEVPVEKVETTEPVEEELTEEPEVSPETSAEEPAPVVEEPVLIEPKAEEELAVETPTETEEASLEEEDNLLQVMMPNMAEYIEITSVRFEKTWVGVPEGQFPSVVVQVYDKANPDIVVREITLTYDGTLLSVHEWKDLPYRDGKGNVIDYGIREIAPNYIIQSNYKEIESYIISDSIIRNTPNNNAIWGVEQPHFIITRPNPSSDELIIWTLNKIDDADQLTFINNLLAAAGGIANNPPLSELIQAYNRGQIIWLYGPSVNYDVYPNDPDKGQVTINVTFNADGTINYADMYFQDPSSWTHFVYGDYSSKLITLTNTYAGATQDWTPVVYKELSGRSLKAEEFTFELYDAGDNLLQTKTNAADGTVTFDPIPYTELDDGKTYTYTIKEVIGTDPAIDYDDLVIEVSVTISYSYNTETGEGKLTVTPTYPKDKTFNNRYQADGAWTPEVEKILKGRDLIAGEFLFDLKTELGAWLDTATNDANGQVLFDEIKYDITQLGTHVYYITERPGELGGVTYTGASIKVTVTVTDNGDGTLEVVVVYDPDPPVFTNVYEAKGSYTPSITKVLTGRTLKKGEFTFALKDAEGKIIQTKTNNADGTVTFDPIPYTQADKGEITYTIVELMPETPEEGMSYDTDPITLTVEVVHKGDGVLEVTGTYSPDSTINNIYTANGSWLPKVTKVLTGRLLTAGEFSFELKDAEGNVLQTKSNLADGSVLFGAVNYTQADIGKTYTYTIVEVVPKPAEGGMTYDPMEVEVKVEIKDAGGGKLEVIVTYPDDTEFNNVYKASGSWTPEVMKALSGRELKADEFSFQLKQGETVLQTKTNAADGTVTFDPINYTQDDIGKTYTYTIVEVVPDPVEEGMEYDSMVVTITVTVEDLGGGELKVTPTYPTDVEFNNIYTATGSFIPAVTKVLDAGGRVLTAGEFKFELRDADGTVLEAKSNDADGKVTFDPIEYDQDDIGETFTYTIVEVVPDPAETGMTYDKMTVTITVTVTDLGGGKLEVTPTYSADTEFNNTYLANGSWIPEVSKVLAGRKLSAEEFKFELWLGEKLVGTAYNDADGKIVFEEIHYTQEDIGETYTYTIKEIPGDEGGMTYDPMIVTIEVTITDGGNGELIVEAVYPEDKVFNNSYVADGSWTPAVTKMLSAGGRVLEEGEFTFNLLDSEGKVLQTMTNLADGSVLFDTIYYDQDDLGKTYTYTIVEVVPVTPEGGMTYDPLKVEISVTVTDLGGGKLEVTPTYSDDRVFNNTYTASGNWTPVATKVLAGRTLTEGEFTFQLKQGETVLQTKTNNADGSITFDPINYTQDDIGKTYTYTIVEVTGTEGGMTYDPLVITYTVEVTDAGDGKLTITASVPDDTEFNNRYAASGSWSPRVQKVLSAGGRVLEVGEFSFVLKDAEGNVLQTKTNGADGSVILDPINYTEADIGKTYTYTIEEVVPEPPEGGMTYDPMVITYTVTVEDAGGGELTVTPSLPEDTIFNNTYLAAGEWTPLVTKVLDAGGRLLLAGDFTFQLKEGGTILQTKTNGADGSVIFDPIKYTQDDIGKTYTYTIVEVIGTESGMTYDPMEVTITVEVKDGGDGELELIITYPEDLEFNNSYLADGFWTPEASKVLTGRELSEEEFEFELWLGEELVGTAYNDADGKIVFEDIHYTQEDIGQTYVYTVKEIAGTETGMVYNELEITITVVVTDLGDGELGIDVTYSDDTVFNNIYTANGSWIPIVAKSLVGRVLNEGEFTFELLEGEEVLLSTTNDADGSVIFEEIAYTQDDIGKTFTYTIREVAGVLGGVTYDDLIITVTVLVEDAGQGELIVTVTYSEDKVFNNFYETSGEWLPLVLKVLEGRDLLAGEFTFELRMDGKVVQTKTNNADGTVSFDKVVFDKAGTYKFELVEVKGEAYAVTYDDTVYEVIVVATDNGDGTMTIVPSVKEVTFTNIFKIPVIDVTAIKKWVGGPDDKPVITIQLYRDGKAYGEPVELDGETEYTWKDLDKTDAVGKDYVYTVKEVEVPKYYEVSYSEDGLTITNTWVKKELPKTGMGSSTPLLITGIGLLLVTVYLGFKRKRDDKE